MSVWNLLSPAGSASASKVCREATHFSSSLFPALWSSHHHLSTGPQPELSNWFSASAFVLSPYSNQSGQI